MLALAGISTATAQSQAPKPAKALNAAGLAGESIAILPLTLIGADPSLASDSTFREYRDRRHALPWADSIIGESFQSRAPEVTWVLPPKLRQIARRNPGMVPEPDQMGQAALRGAKMNRVPDPLRTSLRSLTAFTGGRYAMVPAALAFARDAGGGLRADVSLALADTRSGTVPWRALTSGIGATPAEALTAALAAVLPVESSGP